MAEEKLSDFTTKETVESTDTLIGQSLTDDVQFSPDALKDYIVPYKRLMINLFSTPAKSGLILLNELETGTLGFVSPFDGEMTLTSQNPIFDYNCYMRATVIAPSIGGTIFTVSGSVGSSTSYTFSFVKANGDRGTTPVFDSLFIEILKF